MLVREELPSRAIAFATVLEAVEARVPPPSTTVPVPRAVLLFASSVPDVIVVPPE
jgi:hypothetical protein